MTICIAAIAEKKYTVLAADRTLTIQLEPAEFSHEHSSKLYDIGPGLVIGTSGSPMYIPALLRLLARKRKGGDNYIDAVSDAFFTLRREEMEKGILRRFGWDYPTYEKYYKDGNLLEAHARKITEEMDEFHACLHIVAGTVLPSGEASISVIEDPYGAQCMDAIGFVSVGSGADYADQVFARANYTSEMPLSDAIIHVVEAKKLAEQAYGVGRRTDIRVVVSPRRIVQLSDQVVSNLVNLCDRKNAKQATIAERMLKEASPLLKGSLGSLVR
jgi:hypothetical protein